MSCLEYHIRDYECRESLEKRSAALNDVLRLKSITQLYQILNNRDGTSTAEVDRLATFGMSSLRVRL